MKLPNAEVGMRKSERNAFARRTVVACLLSSAFCILRSSLAFAAPSQQDVFKSIQTNVSESADPTKFFAFLLVAAGLVILLAVLNARRGKSVKPKTLNHQGRLLKEIARSCDLKSAEVRQLKLLVEQRQDVTSPLTLLLCPSVLTQTVREHAAKVDKKVILGIARKLG